MTTIAAPDLGATRRRGAASVSRLIDVWWTLSGILVVLVLWQAAYSLHWINPRFVSSPLEVFRTAIDLIGDGSFWKDAQLTVTELGYGMGAAAATGIPLGLAAGRIAMLRAAVDPHITALYVVPRLALIPVVILWFGIGMEAKAAVVFLGAFFPIVMMSMEGARLVEPRLLKVARSYGASRWRTFRVIVLPSSVPYILTGLRLGIGRGLVSVVAAEMFVANAGLGFRIGRAAQTLDTAVVLVGAMLIASAGAAAMALVQLLENRLGRWKA